MPYFTSEHLKLSLDWLAANGHPLLVSLLAGFRAGLPMSDADSNARPFGAREENVLFSDYFRPDGGPEERPYYVPFGFGAGASFSPWRDHLYASRSLQRMRKDRRNSGVIFKQSSMSNRLWSFRSSLVEDLRERSSESIGTVPFTICYLAIWLYRTRDVTSTEEAVTTLIDEFNLRAYGVVENIFSTAVPAELSSIPLQAQPLEASEIQFCLKQPAEAPTPIEDLNDASGGPIADEAPGRWDLTAADLGDLGGLVGLETAALQALAALRSGMHVIFTGPPGTGKTSLAVHLCKRAGFLAWTASATDQWTTFDTIGGYFPAVHKEGPGEQLDFLAGHVVDTIERKHCLIIDEINRADIDKAFGELFTLLSGQAVTLPFRRKDSEDNFRRIRLVHGSATQQSDVDAVEVPTWWRILGAMNDADKQSLKQLSYAFMRRFAFISVPIPPAKVYETLLRESGNNTLPSGFIDTLVTLFANEELGFGAVGLPFGPAIPLTMIKHARQRIEVSEDISEAALLREVLESYVVPQLQGRADLHRGVKTLLTPLLGAEMETFSRRLSVWTGYIPGPADDEE